MTRTVGSTGRNKERLWKALRKEYGEDFDPIVEMSGNSMFLQGIANNAKAEYRERPELNELKDKAVEAVQTANGQWKEVAPYLAAKYQTVTLEGPEDENGIPTAVTITLIKANNDESSPTDQ